MCFKINAKTFLLNRWSFLNTARGSVNCSVVNNKSNAFLFDLFMYYSTFENSVLRRRITWLEEQPHDGDTEAETTWSPFVRWGARHRRSPQGHGWLLAVPPMSVQRRKDAPNLLSSLCSFTPNSTLPTSAIQSPSLNFPEFYLRLLYLYLYNWQSNRLVFIISGALHHWFR